MVYDPASGRWANAGSFPNAKSGSLALGLPSWTGFSATGLHSGDVLLAGGSLLQGTTSGGAPIYVATSQVMRWDHSTGLLAPAESMPVANSSHSTAVLTDGRVLLVGGVEAVAVHGSVDPVARAEITTRQLGHGRRQHHFRQPGGGRWRSPWRMDEYCSSADTEFRWVLTPKEAHVPSLLFSP